MGFMVGHLCRKFCCSDIYYIQRYHDTMFLQKYFLQHQYHINGNYSFINKDFLNYVLQVTCIYNIIMFSYMKHLLPQLKGCHNNAYFCLEINPPSKYHTCKYK